MFRGFIFRGAVFAVFLLACDGFAQVSSRSVSLSGERALKADIEVGALKLILTSHSAPDVFRYEFDADDTTTLQCLYDIRNGVGYLELHNNSQDKNRKKKFRLRDLFGGEDDEDTEHGRRSNAILRLSLTDSIPIHLDLTVGAANTELDFSGLKLSNFSLSSGACAAKVRFKTPNRVTMQQMKLSTGASKLIVEGLGNANFERLEMSGGASDVVLDFDGKGCPAAKANLSIGAGSLRIILPPTLDVDLNYSNDFFSTFRVPDAFEKNGDTYILRSTNGANNLKMNVSSGMGSVRIKLKGEEK